MNRLAMGLACTLVLVTGCTKPETKPAPTATATVAPPYTANLPMIEIMEHVMNPAGYQFWGGWGVIVDKNGAHDLTPKNDAEWKKVEDGATTIVLATDAIMIPAYAREPVADWNRYALEVQALAIKGREAAEKKDKDAIGTIGEQLDVACDGCHGKFAIPQTK